MKVAVIGSGIAGMAAADALHGHAQVTLLEAAGRFGGHAHTVDVTLPDVGGREVTHGVDTGFLVFNERTYPGLVALFERLGVDCQASDMSFSVQVPRGRGQHALEWSGSNLNTVFAQRSNLLRPRLCSRGCRGSPRWQAPWVIRMCGTWVPWAARSPGTGWVLITLRLSLGLRPR